MCLSACNYEADRYIIDVEDLKTESITARESYAVQEEDAIHEEPVPIEEVLAHNATSYNGQSLQYEYVLLDGKILRIDAAVCVSDIEVIHNQQYIMGYVMAYGNQGRTPFYWLVYKRVLDEMVVNAYNDLTFYVGCRYWILIRRHMSLIKSVKLYIV